MSNIYLHVLVKLFNLMSECYCEIIVVCYKDKDYKLQKKTFLQKHAKF